MNPSRRILGSVTAAAVALAAVLSSAQPAQSSDHQDTFNLANRANTSADITDVYVFPAADPKNVVFAINVSPLTPAGASPSFDPTLMWQIKIAHGGTSPEDQVIQFGVTGTGTSQIITMYGPAKPNEVGTSNTFVAAAGSFNYNVSTQLNNGAKVFAGPRADPFIFDLFAFFSFLGDRHYATHSAEADATNPGPPPGFFNGDNVGAAATFAPAYDKPASRASQPSFNGFAAGTMSGTGPGAYACITQPSQNALADIGGGFNVLTFVVEVPRTLLTTGFASSKINVWATVNSSTGS